MSNTKFIFRLYSIDKNIKVLYRNANIATMFHYYAKKICSDQPTYRYRRSTIRESQKQS